MVVFQLVWSIALDTFHSMCMTWEHNVFPLPTILVLRYAWIHICTLDSYNLATHIKVPVNDTFSLRTTLSILNINPNNSYIWFWWSFDNMEFWGKSYIVKNIF